MQVQVLWYSTSCIVVQRRRVQNHLPALRRGHRPKLLADLRRAGRAMPVKDSLIAATALVHELVVATPNVSDFKQAGVKLVDPFA